MQAVALLCSAFFPSPGYAGMAAQAISFAAAQVSTHSTNFASWPCRDPLANSFVAPLTADPAEDPRLVVEEFERSAEDDAEYGIDHLKNLDLHDDQGGAEPAAAG